MLKTYARRTICIVQSYLESHDCVRFIVRPVVNVRHSTIRVIQSYGNVLPDVRFTPRRTRPYVLRFI